MVFRYLLRGFRPLSGVAATLRTFISAAVGQTGHISLAFLSLARARLRHRMLRPELAALSSLRAFFCCLKEQTSVLAGAEELLEMSLRMLFVGPFYRTMILKRVCSLGRNPIRARGTSTFSETSRTSCSPAALRTSAFSSESSAIPVFFLLEAKFSQSRQETSQYRDKRTY